MTTSLASAYERYFPVIRTSMLPKNGSGSRMPTSEPVVHRQTIKQAKAAYKARGEPPISEKERKQLLRSVELDKRAWGAKEREKRKSELQKKKVEKDRKEKAERPYIQFGSQRRCDRFGYKSSQYHLRAFFSRGAAVKQETEKENVLVEVEEENGFSDDGVDDDSLLDVLHSPEAMPPPQQCPNFDGVVKGTASIRASAPPRSESGPLDAATEDDLNDFWAELGSSTQMARELLADTGHGEKAVPGHLATALSTTTFGSTDFDLTVEDLEELTPPVVKLNEVDKDPKLMPPPALPSKIRDITTPLPVKPPSREVKTTTSVLFAPPVQTGFTLTDLESFVEDDLQLTQMAPG